MIKRHNESDYNLQLRFLISLRSSEGDRKYHVFLFLFSFIFYLKQKITIYLTNEITIYFSMLAKEPQIN